VAFDSVVATTREWVETVVIDLNLCPFAQRELSSDRVRFVATEGNDEEQLLVALETELALLNQDPLVETTLLIHPNVLQNFFDYNQFLNLADGLLVEMKLDGVYQVASFHPDYQFGGTKPDDAENYTNRSPYPMLHLIREASLERAIADYPDIDQVPERNVALTNEMGKHRLDSLLKSCFGEGDKSKP
jgi:hypothetical protein